MSFMFMSPQLLRCQLSGRGWAWYPVFADGSLDYTDPWRGTAPPTWAEWVRQGMAGTLTAFVLFEHFFRA